MSAKKGSQKHQNKEAWKFDKHKTDPKTKLLQNLQVIVLCKNFSTLIVLIQSFEWFIMIVISVFQTRFWMKFFEKYQGCGAATKKLGAVSAPAPAPPSKRRGYQKFLILLKFSWFPLNHTYFPIIHDFVPFCADSI